MMITIMISFLWEYGIAAYFPNVCLSHIFHTKAVTFNGFNIP